MLEMVIEGKGLKRGAIYIPDDLLREDWIKKLPLNEQEEEKRFREVDAPILLDLAKKRLKEYQIDPQLP